MSNLCPELRLLSFTLKPLFRDCSTLWALNSELGSEATYKARIVVQGSNVKTATGEEAYFSDTSSAPTNMAVIRSVLAYGELSGGGSSQADAEQAYIQPLLPDDIKFFLTIPSHLMTAEMKTLAASMYDPVFRLRRPLYGWSRSGNIWEKTPCPNVNGIRYAN